MSITNNEISRLSSFPDDYLSVDDLFLISEESENSSAFVSKNIKFSVIDNNFTNNFLKVEEFSPNGKCTFKELTIPTKTVVSAFNDGNMSCVLNNEYLSSVFLTEFKKIYSILVNDKKPHIPSYVGDVIFSTNSKCRTEEGVKEFYGQDTSWEPIECRFILATDASLNGGVGGVERLVDADITGGEESVELGLDVLPSHYHEFVAEDNREEFNHSYNYKPVFLSAGNDVAVLDKTAAEGNLATAGHTDAGWSVQKTEADITIGYPKSSDNSVTLYGNDGADITVRPSGTTKESKMFHNNMPPFYGVYMWQRVK